MRTLDLRPGRVAQCLLARLRRAGSDERGAVLVLMAVVMVLVMLPMAALAIDVGSFYQAQRQAQSAADAGALAGAQALTSGSAAAQAAATTLATTNYPAASPTASQPTSTSVKVTVNASTPSFFGQILGVTHANVSASATAALTRTFTPCSSASNGCLAIFAKQQGCASNSIVFGGGVHVTGGVWSNGSIDFGGGGSSWGPTSYGTGCTPKFSGGNYTFTPAVSDPSPQTPEANWPIPYGNDFPACGGSGQPACTGPCDNGGSSCSAAYHTPSFCTVATNAGSETLQTYSPVNVTSGQIYCDVGGGAANANDPSTWTGVMTINASNGSTQSSFVAGSFIIGGGSNLKACGYVLSGYTASTCNAAVPAPNTTNYPILYAANGSINAASGGANFTGDLYAPNGAISIGGGTSTAFMEGQTVNWSAGGITGTGPVDSGSGGLSTSSQALTQ